MVVLIVFLVKDIKKLKDEYNKYYLKNGIAYRMINAMEFTADPHTTSFINKGSDYYKEVAIGDSPFETESLNHYLIKHSTDEYYYIEGIKSQCMFDLPLLRPSMKNDVKNVVLLCDMMQRVIINYPNNNLTNDQDCYKLRGLMTELLFIFYDKGKEYTPEITKLGYGFRSTKSKYQSYSKEDYVYTLDDFEAIFKCFNTFLDGEGHELFQDLLNKYSPKPQN